LTSREFILPALVAAAVALATPLASAAPLLYFNGFETDLSDSPTTSWSGGGVARVASGSGGIPSADGAFHATTSSTGAFGRWGGYNFGAGNAVPTPFESYRTSVDIYLNIAGGWANDTRFDFSSAINNSAGTHLRDFIFNAGFYNDASGPGANTDRFVISASNNSQPGSAFAKNPAMDPIVISTTGWYTFEHTFYDNGGVLAVDMKIFDATDTLINSWTLSNPADLIAGVGGNRYGWFDYNQFSTLAFDNALLELLPADRVPEPGTVLLIGASLFGLAATRRRRASLGLPEMTRASARLPSA
jgi:hypothetical protein